MKTPALETKRLYLRPMALADAPAIQKYFSNWDIIQHLSKAVPWPYPEDGAKAFIQSYLDNPDDRFLWAITVKDFGNEAIGSLEYRIEESRDGNRGFWIAVPFQGKGYMTEAVDALNKFVFNTLGIEKYLVCNLEQNTRSARVKEKTGAIFLDYIELEHHSGNAKTARWIVTKESWLNSPAAQDYCDE